MIIFLAYFSLLVKRYPMTISTPYNYSSNFYLKNFRDTKKSTYHNWQYHKTDQTIENQVLHSPSIIKYKQDKKIHR